MPEAPPKIHLMIGTPCYGGNVTHHYMISMINLQVACIERGIELSFSLLGGDSLIPRARNTVIAEFIDDPTATHLLFVDADIGFHPDQVFRLLELDKEVCGAVYPLKHHDWDLIRSHVAAGREAIPAGTLSYVVEFLDAGAIRSVDGFTPVRYLGTGFMLLQRGAVERMMAHYPELKFRTVHTTHNAATESDHRYALFDCVIDRDSGVYLSEDYTFCRRWRALGGEIWADLQSKLTHVGSVAFHGDLMAIFDPPKG